MNAAKLSGVSFLRSRRKRGCLSNFFIGKVLTGKPSKGVRGAEPGKRKNQTQMGFQVKSLSA